MDANSRRKQKQEKIGHIPPPAREVPTSSTSCFLTEESSQLHRMSRHFRPVFPCMLAGLLLCVLLHSSRIGVVSPAPICALHGQSAGCHTPSLADMFDRVIQHSARMHSISSDLHSHFEQFFLPSKNHIHRVNRHCHTSTILTPNGKENAQRLARGELTEVILRLLVAWRDPLWHLHQNMAHQDNSNSFSSDKALEMSDMVHELRRGVEKVAKKMQNLGILGNSENSLVAPGALVPLSNNGEWRLMNDYDLLYCFRRDSDKVQNYLKILKCRIVPEHGC